MSEEKIENNTGESQDDIKRFYIQSINFETFLKIVAEVNMVDSVYLYNMPNHIKSYSKNVDETTKALFSIFENEDEKWRVKAAKQVQMDVGENGITFSNYNIVDSDLCLCMPIINSIVLIPGPKSIENGWDVTKIVQFTNMVSMTPMLLRLTDVEDSENPSNHKISVSYEVIEGRK